MIELLARNLAQLYRPIAELRAFRNLDLGRVALRVVASGSRDRTRRGEDARPRNIALIDRHLQAYIAVSGAFGLKIAHRGEALLKRTTRRNRGSSRTIGNRELENLDVIAAFIGIFALQEQMGVRLDQSRKHGRVRKINRGGIRRNTHRGGIAHALDAIAANHDHLIGMGLITRAIDQSTRTNHRHLLGGTRVLRKYRNGQKTREQEHTRLLDGEHGNTSGRMRRNNKGSGRRARGVYEVVRVTPDRD